ncbi:Aminopeptidase [hydrothermal vent metagenome]|uniref:Aminopeptidase n=1 Tax=hydrothermal vent metagenome TaxID=652676 RepID=A0A3B0TLQ2_9ZZZZ
MRQLAYLLTLFILVSCGSTKLQETNKGNISPPADPEGVKGSVVVVEKQEEIKDAAVTKTIAQVPNFSNSGGVGKIMNFLASDELKGRDTGSEGIEKAAQFIEAILKENNIMPYFSSYRDTISNFDKPAYNIAGIIEGNDPSLKNEFVIIGAHYDHIGIQKAKNGDAIANGANDNAAGTTTVLELLRYFGNAKTNKRSLLFAFFTAEEKGLLGSKHLAEKLKEKGLDLYVMLNYEMVGVPLIGKDYVAYASGYERSNLADICNRYADEKLVGFLPKAKEFSLFKRSDNYSFHKVFNVPSQTFSTFDFTNFDHYHKVGDEADIMDFEHMATLVNKFIPVVEGIANAPVKEIKYH